MIVRKRMNFVADARQINFVSDGLPRCNRSFFHHVDFFRGAVLFKYLSSREAVFLLSNRNDCTSISRGRSVNDPIPVNVTFF